MSTSRIFWKRVFLAAITSISMAAPLLAAPPVANDDSYPSVASLRVDADDTLVIPDSALLGNDTGDAIDVDSVVESTSSGGAALTRNSNSIAYDPAGVSQYEALDDGDNATDTFDYTIAGDESPDSPGDERATVSIRVDGVNDRPTLTNLNDDSLDDDASITPFSSETIGDPDSGETLTVTVTIDPAGDGDFTTLSGFSSIGSGQYQRSGSAGALTTALRALEFTPTKDLYAVDSINDVDVTVLVEDEALSVEKSLTLSVTSVNDNPTIAPTTLSASSLFAGAIVTPFSGVDLGDVDIIVPETDEDAVSGSDVYTATIVLTGGTLNADLFESSGSTYTYTAAVETGSDAFDEFVAVIRGVEYVAPAVDGTFTATLTLTDPNGGVSNALVFTANVTAPASGVTGIIQDQQVADNGTIIPFSTIVFNSLGSVDKEVSITIDDDAKGVLELLGPFSRSGPTYTMTGDAIEATEAIQNLRFRPTENRIALSGAQTFEVSSFNITVASINVTDGEPIRVRVVPINDDPTIAGIRPTIRIDDDETVKPLSTVLISDVDELGAEELTVVVSFIGEDVATGLPLAGGGVLANATYNSSLSGDDTITFAGTPSEVEAILRDLTFTPDPNRNPVGERETVSFSIFLDDGDGGVALNSSTDVIVTSVNGAPLISGIPAPSQQPFPIAASADLSGEFTALPFERISVSDEDNISFEISFDAAKGSLSEDDFEATAPGVYALKVDPSDPLTVTAALQAVVFTSADDPSAGVETTFTFTTTDGINSVSETFTIVLRERNLSHIVSNHADSGAGSLREAIELAGNNDFIVFDFPNEDFPVTIELESTLEVDKNLTIVGSGVQELTISGGERVALFSVVNESQFVIERLTLKDGFSPSFGGAIAVDMGSTLVARYCSFEGNVAGQYGGAIDLFLGDLLIENCYFADNAVLGSQARGGGGISIYSTGEVAVRNSTFYRNVQGYETGFGGGAIYLENGDLALDLELSLEHCTFLENFDASMSGSAVHAKNTGAEVHCQNTIFAGLLDPLDEFDQPIPQGRVLDVSNGGAFSSLGGNLATDATTTTYTQNQISQNVTLLDATFDLLSTDPKLLAPAYNGGITRTCDLQAGSPAIDSLKVAPPTIDSTAIDQRGYWRDSTPDIGAVEADNFERVQINEIFVNLDVADTAFVEFYVPRDSVALNLQDLEFYVDDALGSIFGDLPLDPGAGSVWTATIPLNPEKGTLQVRNPSGQVLLSVDYVGTFAEQGTELDTVGQSMTRYALYEGGFLPHRRIVERVTGVSGGDETSPGNDVTGAPLGGGNAPPIAVVDLDEEGLPVYAINADKTLRPDILVNDIEFDRADIIKITEVTEIVSGVTINQELFTLNGSGAISFTDLPLADGSDSTFGNEQAVITVDGDGLGLLYDPTASDDFIGLALGETATDLWAYTILDYDAASPTTPRSRGADASLQMANLVRATTYFAVVVTGINEAPTANTDTAATEENQAIRLLADTDLLDPAVFDFGDLPEDFQDFDASGAQVTLLPLKPTVALLANDDDVDSDDTNRTIRLIAVHQSSAPGDLLITTSELGASVLLDLRADRRETGILYDPRGSATLDALADGEIAVDRFFYSVIDQHGARSVAEVIITVTGVNDMPTATDDEGIVANEDEALSIADDELLGNDTDPDQDGSGPDDMPVISAPLLPATSNLGALLSFDGMDIVYDPRTIEAYESLARNESLIDTFDYTIDDGFGGLDTATVAILVEGENDAPVAIDYGLSLFENQTVFVGAGEVNGLLVDPVDVDINNSVPDDDPWVIPQLEVVTPLGADLDIFSNGSYRYNANSPAIDSLYEGEIAIEIFPFTITDNFRTTASDDRFTITGNQADVVLPVLYNDAVVGAQALPVLAYTEDSGDTGIVIIESPNHALRDGLLIQVKGYEGAGGYNGVYPITGIDRDHFSIPVPFESTVPTVLGTWRPWIQIAALTVGDQGGTLASLDGQTVTYTPPIDFYGIETFSYTIEDGVGGQDVGVVEVDVRIAPFNGLIGKQGETFRVGMGQTEVEVDVLLNDNTLPALGSELAVISVVPVGGATGTAVPTAGADGIVYTPPNPTFVGSESFDYTISGGGTSTAIATVTFVVEDRTDLLSGSDDAFFVITGSGENLLPVLVNDPNLPTFPVGSSLVSVSSPSSGGTAVVEGDQIRYTPPDAPFLGVENFEYTAADASGASTTQAVRILVVPEAVDFFAQPDNYRVVAGSGPILLPILLNDGAVDNEAATLSVVNLGLDTDSPPDITRVAIAGGGTLVEYIPPSSPTTEDFNYEISIGTIDRREAKITIEVVESYDLLPVAVDDRFSVEKNEAAVSLDVLVNDLPYPDAGYIWEITAADATGSQGGTVEIVDGSSLSYTPPADFIGMERFTYTISDVFGANSTATVIVDVGALVTATDVFALMEDSVDNPLPVLLNDDFLDRYAAEYRITDVGTPDQGGSVSIDGAGPDNHLLYTPLPGFDGVESLSYTVEDDTGGTRIETVTITVLDLSSDRDDGELTVTLTGVNDIPVLFGTSDKSTTDKLAIKPFDGVSITDLDEWGNQLQEVTIAYDVSFGTVTAPGMTMIGVGTYRILDTPAVVTAALNAFLFTPFENYIDYIDYANDNSIGDVDFTLTIDDYNLSVSDSADAPIVDVTTVNVEPINDTPTIVSPIPDQLFKVNSPDRGYKLTDHFADVDDDVPSGELTWSVSDNTNPPLFDSVTIDGAKQLIVFDFAADQFGVAEITVRGTDRGGLFVEDTFTVTVDGPPVIDLEEGELNPARATEIPGTVDFFSQNFRQAFRVTNEGETRADAFIVHLQNFFNGQPLAVTIESAEYSTDENGTTENFNDDPKTSEGVTVNIIEEDHPVVFAVKFDVPLEPDESTIVHFVYRANELGNDPVRPDVRIELTGATPTSGAGVLMEGMDNANTGEVHLIVNLMVGDQLELQYSGDLVDWTPWATPLPVIGEDGFDREFKVVDDGLNTDPHPSLMMQRFYRVVDITPPPAP